MIELDTANYTQQNRDVLASLRIHNMTTEEIVENDSKVESHFHKSDSIWWREVKPYFYHPAVPLFRIAPGEARPKPWAALGGYYHFVPDGAPANGSITAVEISDLAHYSLESLKNKRNQIARASAYFRVKRVTRLSDLLEDGWKVYQDWEKRTENVRVKRSDPEVFKRWITRSFHHPHILVLGAYDNEKLVAFIFVEASNGVANITKNLSLSAYRELTPSSLLIYSAVSIAANSPGIEKVWTGLRSLIPSLDRFKFTLGFRYVSYPAYIHLRSALRPIVKRWMPMEYRRLTGEYDDTNTGALRYTCFCK